MRMGSVDGIIPDFSLAHRLSASPFPEEMMEDEGIGLVLARATELRFNISNCIPRATTTPHAPPSGLLPPQHADTNHEDSSSPSSVDVNEADDEENKEEEAQEAEAERLFNICDALKSLETQQSSLQVLQRQQWYEREVALAEIESYCKMLIDKLKEYKGKELEVLHEALLLLAIQWSTTTISYFLHIQAVPYVLCLEKEYLSPIPPMHKSAHNRKITIDPMIDSRKSVIEKEQNHVQAGDKSSRKRLRLFMFITSAAKTMLTVVGLVSFSAVGSTPEINYGCG